MVNCRELDVQVDNLSRPDAEEGDYQVGDQIQITFTGLSMPVQKMAAVYNPNYPSEGWVEYQTNIGQNLQSESSQYNAVTPEQSKITYTFSEPGEIKLTNGRIHNTHLGSGLNYHREIPLEGVTKNFEASTGSNSPYFSTLPDITFNVKPNADEVLASFMYSQLQYWEVNGQRTDFSAGDRASLDAVRNVNLSDPLFAEENGDDLTTTDIVMKAVPYNSDVTLTARYRQEGTDEWTDLGEFKANTEVTLMEDVSAKAVHFVEVTVTPNNPANGEPHTYTVRLISAQNDNVSVRAALPILTQLKFDWGDSEVTEPDGLLQATGDNLGYGFHSGRYEYTLTVPEGIDTTTLNFFSAGRRLVFDSEIDDERAFPYRMVKAGDEIIANYNEFSNQESTVGSVPLSEDTPITITLKDDTDRTTTYTINVKVAVTGGYTFNNLIEGSTLVLKDSTGARANPTDGVYTLRQGDTYTYIYSCPGYVTETGYITVPALQDGETTPKDLTEMLTPLQPVAQTEGEATVRIAGFESMFQPTTTVTIDTEGAADLYAEQYVKYNYGGYTVLHALIEATGNKAFSCTNGVFVPEAKIDENASSGSGWVCEVNDEYVESPWETLLNKGDKVEFYWNSNHPTMRHAWLEPETVSVAEGETVTLTLYAAPVENGRYNPKEEGSVLSSATVLLDGEALSTLTDANGKIIVPTSGLSKGIHRVTAQLVSSDKNILTYAETAITVTKSDTSSNSVTFRLIGSTKAENPVDFSKKMGVFEGPKDTVWGTEYVTWIGTTEYSLDGVTGDVTVGDVFKRVVDNAGLSYVGLDSGYISSITAPEAYGGYELAEFTNGNRSGWMYTLNGTHATGINTQTVTAGDEIIFHYVNDYIYEVPDHHGGSYGDSSVWEKWLEAEDIVVDSPLSDDGVIAYLMNAIPPEDIDADSEWILLAIATAGQDIPQEYIDNYIKAVGEKIGQSGENLSTMDPIDIAGIIHALDAVHKDGEDPVVNNINLLAHLLEDINRVLKESRNAAESAAKTLISIDAHEHDANDQNHKELRQFLLDNQIKDGEHKGAWKKNPGAMHNSGSGIARVFSFRFLMTVGATGTADPCLDTTLTVLRALAPYYNMEEADEEIDAAIEAALEYIKQYQTADGGFNQNGDKADVISTAKAIAALSVLGIDPESFNGKNVVAALEQFVVEQTVGETTYTTYRATSGTDTDNNVTGEVAEALYLLDVAKESGSLSSGKTPPPEDIKKIYENTRDHLITLPTPKVDPISGEWMILGLARAQAIDDNADLADYLKDNTSGYLAKVAEEIEGSSTFAQNGQLNKNKPTENERIALALLSLGIDPTNFEGHDLLKALEDTDWVNRQGVNSTAFALIDMQACDDAEFTNYTFDYDVRDKLIQHLQETQIKVGNDQGVWTTTGTLAPDGSGSGNIDTTSMILTALAPYYDTNSDAKAMIDTTLTWLEKQRQADGSVGTSSENVSQAIVALTTLDSRATTLNFDLKEAWFKDGASLMDALKSYYIEDNGQKGFKNTASDKGYNQMSTEQGFYALVAYLRWAEGKPALFDMSETDENVVDIGDYSITIDVPTGGKLEVSVKRQSATTTQLSTSARADEGDTIKVTVTPDEGYRMVEGSLVYTKDDAGSAPVSIDESTLTFTMPASDITISCKWEKVDGEYPEYPDDPSAPDDSVKPAITEFWIGQFEGIIDQESNSIVVTLPLDAKLRGIVPKITTENTESMSPAKGEAVNFDGSAVKYNLVGTDGVTTRTYTVTIQLDNEMYFEKLWDQVEDLRDESGWWDKAESNKQSPGNDYKDYWGVR